MADIDPVLGDLSTARLPPAPAPAANYSPVRESDGVLYVAGQTPHVQGDLPIRGIVGRDVSEREARSLARLAALNVLAALAAHVESLDTIAIASVTGFIAATPEFGRHPWVMDGASDAFVEALGERGRHSRAAVGVASLPDGAPVELSVVAVRR